MDGGIPARYAQSFMRPELFTIPWLNYAVSGYGAAVVLAFLGGTWWMTRRAMKVKADPDICLSLSLICLVFGWLGGRTFYVIHYWETQFAHQPSLIFNMSAGGFEVYGGLMTAAVFCLLYLWIKGVSLRLYCDMAAPTVLFGMGVGRIGCFLVGCCWGTLCPASLPWGVTFPPGSPAHEQQWKDRLLTLPAEMILCLPQDSIPIYSLRAGPGGLHQKKDFFDLPDMNQAKEKLAKARTDIESLAGDPVKYERAQFELAVLDGVINHFDKFEVTPQELGRRLDGPEFRSLPVHPAQIYSAIGPLLLAWLTSAYFYRRKRHGTVLALAMILYAIERFIEEMLRLDNPLDTYGLTIAQGISIAWIVFASLWYLILRRMPLQSSRPAMKKRAPQPEVAAAAKPAVG